VRLHLDFWFEERHFLEQNSAFPDRSIRSVRTNRRYPYLPPLLIVASLVLIEKAFTLDEEADRSAKSAIVILMFGWLLE
jgi:hypothetical protein